MLMTAKAPPILLEIFAWCKEEKKDEMKDKLNQLQKQLEVKSHQKRARILYYVANDESTTQDVHKWFIENCNCKYYLYIDSKGENFSVSDDFVKNALARIKKFEKTFTEMKESGINVGVIRKHESALKAV